MALVKSTMLSAISGSIAGATFARNSSGMYMRQRAVPVNPNTDNQIRARAAMTNTASSWRELSDLDQAAWKTYAQNTPTLNKIGDVIHLSGIAQYVKLNGFRQYLGEALHTSAPALYGAALAITEVTATITETSQNVDLTTVAGSSLQADDLYGVWISNAISTGVTFYKGPWNFLSTVPGDVLLTTMMPIPFTVAEDQSFKLRLRYHDSAFRMSNEYISPFIVVGA